MDTDREEIAAQIGNGEVHGKIFKSHGSIRWIEFVLRVGGVGATLAASVAMGKDKQTVSIFGAPYTAEYNYLTAFVFFVVANAIACTYLFVSVPISLLKPHSNASIKFVLFGMDLVMMALVTAGASAATATADVRNFQTQPLPICKVFGKFCDHVHGALLFSFTAVIIFMVITMMSALSLYNSR